MLSSTAYQIFPITSGTYVGTATTEALKELRIVKALADGNITINYSTPVVIAALAGMDFYIQNDGSDPTVTSAAAIMMS